LFQILKKSGMAFKPVNIRATLIRERGLLNPKEHRLLEVAGRILQAALDKDLAVNDKLRKANFDAHGNTWPAKVRYRTACSLRVKSRHCARYRLRFLDSSAFKPDFPYGAIAEINSFERDNRLMITKFKMIAPSGMFILCFLHRREKNVLPFASMGVLIWPGTANC
jgi:hypothetical protein